MNADNIPKTFDEALDAWWATEPNRREACAMRLYEFSKAIYVLATEATDLGLTELATRHRGHADAAFLAAELLRLAAVDETPRCEATMIDDEGQTRRCWHRKHTGLHCTGWHDSKGQYHSKAWEP